MKKRIDNKRLDLSRIPIEVLDKSYVRYEPYNLGITHRHPLKKHRIIKESDFKQKAQYAKDVILNTYPISEEQFVIVEGHNGMFTAILTSLIENNVEIIEEAMLKLGFFRCKPTDKTLQDSKSRKWIDLRFEPNPSYKIKSHSIN